VILLDTDVVSGVMKPRPPEALIAWLDSRTSSDLFLSTVTVAEIGYGLSVLPTGRRRRDLTQRFEIFLERAFDQRILSFDLPAAHLYADLMARRRELGRPMSAFDGQIAAIARAHGFAVATRNVRDFEECGLEILNPFGEGSARQGA
jgi:toxin FitB